MASSFEFEEFNDVLVLHQYVGTVSLNRLDLTMLLTQLSYFVIFQYSFTLLPHINSQQVRSVPNGEYIYFTLGYKMDDMIVFVDILDWRSSLRVLGFSDVLFLPSLFF